LKDLRIVFLGTPEFAVASLEALVLSGINVVGVVTAPDKPVGRNRELQGSAVKEYALKMGLRLLQPEKLKNEAFLDELRSLQADLQIVVAFRMLPVVVWDMPRLGTFNLHGSLLPKYRGAAPINWAIMNGEIETGVTTFFLQHEIDTGPLIFQEKLAIDHTDTIGSLYPKLMALGAELVVKTVVAMKNGNAPSIPQDDLIPLLPAPKLFRENTEIDFERSGNEIYNFIRGLNPVPAAWGVLDEISTKIFDVRLVEDAPSVGKGQLVIENRKLWLGTSTTAIEVLSLQIEGKRKMTSQEYISGKANKK
jgi:methionyl-tRNA formyltransferase